MGEEGDGVVGLGLGGTVAIVCHGVHRIGLRVGRTTVSRRLFFNSSYSAPASSVIFAFQRCHTQRCRWFPDLRYLAPLFTGLDFSSLLKVGAFIFCLCAGDVTAL